MRREAVRRQWSELDAPVMISVAVSTTVAYCGGPGCSLQWQTERHGSPSSGAGSKKYVGDLTPPTENKFVLSRQLVAVELAIIPLLSGIDLKNGSTGPNIRAACKL